MLYQPQVLIGRISIHVYTSGRTILREMYIHFRFRLRPLPFSRLRQWYSHFWFLSCSVDQLAKLKGFAFFVNAQFPVFKSRDNPEMPISSHSHSGQFCKHAFSTLEEVILRAIDVGFEHYGLSEHMPRFLLEDLYEEETAVR